MGGGGGCGSFSLTKSDGMISPHITQNAIRKAESRSATRSRARSLALVVLNTSTEPTTMQRTVKQNPPACTQESMYSGSENVSHVHLGFGVVHTPEEKQVPPTTPPRTRPIGQITYGSHLSRCCVKSASRV